MEVGGTVGDIESQPFLEAIRQFATEYGRQNCLFLHVTLVPYLAASHEQKTKPTQHSVKELLSIGIQPDVIVLRSEREVDLNQRKKIALFCNVAEDCVIQNLEFAAAVFGAAGAAGKRAGTISFAAVLAWTRPVRI